MYEFTHYEVRDVMTSRVVTIGAETSLGEVESIFETHDFNGLPVVDDARHLLGMVTKLDVLKAFAFSKGQMVPRYDEIMKSRATLGMSECPRVVSPETPLTRVLQDMVDTRHKSFPVTDGNRLVGIVAREDILGALRASALGLLPDRTAGSGHEVEDLIGKNT
jgi:CBS domain-containing protein